MTATEPADGIIRLMPETLANKIAAGEVVQRPASALKELIENSLDAGARSVTVVVKGAGGELMQVVDDGSGMSAADALACLRRHATSKIRAVEDLDTLRTLGFRGEALASIASIARVEIKTRRQEDAAGVRVRVEGGEVTANEPVATAAGTSLSVRNLFYNVPARRAFLKTPATEYRHLLDTFQTLALSHPRVAFALFNGDEEVYRLPAHPEGSFYDALAARIRSLWDDEQARGLVAAEESTSYLTARGLLGRPELARKQRGQQFVFVNGRYVRNRSVEHAVRTAYEGLIGGGEHPFFVLFLDLDPRHVDVNVHPTKAEIKFDDDQGIYAFVRAVARRAMSMGGLHAEGAGEPDALRGTSMMDRAPLDAADAPDVSDAGTASADAPLRSAPPRPSGGWSMPSSAPRGGRESGLSRPRLPSAPTLSAVEQSDLLFRPVPPATLPSLFSGEAPASAASAQPDLLVQLHGAYILASTRSGLVIIDQQAAHERVLFERALDSLENGLALSQQMMPETYTFSAPDLSLLKTLLPRLRALGFSIQVGTGRAAVVTGLPTDVSVGEARSLLEDVLDQYREEEEQDGAPVAPTVALARSIARRRALRRGTPLDAPRMRDLVDELFACATPFAAPDGRPTLIQLTVGDLDRRFGRG